MASRHRTIQARRRTRRLCLAVLTPLAASAPSQHAVAQELEMGVHRGLDCDQCHVVGPQGRPRAPVSLAGRQEVVCAACHPEITSEGGATSHPSGTVPGRPLPARFPLDREGRMTCSTCHDLHSAAPRLLRDAERWSCAACHPR